MDAAKAVAQLDGNHYKITSFDKHYGDPECRTTTNFLVTFDDGEQLWKPWSQELFDTMQYEAYIRSHRPLYPLLFTLDAFAKIKTELNKKPIAGVSPGDRFYIDLRLYGYDWYKTLALPNDDDLTYVFECVYTKYPHPIGRFFRPDSPFR